MLKSLPYHISVDTIDKLLPSVLEKGGKIEISTPTGSFFYDPWVLKDEYKGTLWEEVWDSLPVDKGQARLIVLESPSCYTQHADIDDRYHLNFYGDEGYLIDLESRVMYKTQQDGVWYHMDAGILHSAMSVGGEQRIQLVVRQLLNNNSLKAPMFVQLTAQSDKSRYEFDNSLSKWLNRANKRGIISEFEYSDRNVFFYVETEYVKELEQLIPASFSYEFR